MKEQVSSENCRLWRNHAGAKFFHEELQLIEMTHTGAGGKCEEAGAAERNYYGLTTIPHSSRVTQGEGGG